MNKKKCPLCGAVKTKKNGTRKGVQLYKCLVCQHQFRSGFPSPATEIWNAYQNDKQTICQIAEQNHLSTSSVKRRLRKIERVSTQPDLSGQTGYVHLDVTYWGHNRGVMLALDDTTNKPLYVAFVKSETTQDYRTAIDAITAVGYTIKGIIIDGKKALFKEFQDHPMQMCQFHMLQIVRRYLTGNPKMKASIDWMLLMREMKHLTKEVFEAEYAAWKERYAEFLNKRVTHKDGKSCYLHRKVRTVVHSIDFYLPYLFTFQCPECAGMPNTNNKIEGTFTDLKKSLNNHTGMSMQNRKRFISGFFLQRLN